jgi:hypothetical protein
MVLPSQSIRKRAVRPGEMPRPKKISIACITLAIAIVAVAFLPSESQAQPPAQDVVVLVDSSESMAPRISAITWILSKFVGGSREGDSFTCYQFSNKSVLIARQKFEKRGDVAAVRSQIGNLRARGKQTNYSPAIERAMADIRTSHKTHPANERVLILITDGRRHPDDTKTEKRTFEKLLEKNADLEPDVDYSFYCFYLGDWFEDDLQAYLLSAEAHLANWPTEAGKLKEITIADVYIAEQSVFLGRLPDTPAQRSFPIAFYPRRPAAEITIIEFDVRAKFTEKKTLERYFSVNPKRLICRPEPWKEKFNIETRGFDMGTYSGTFEFRPSHPEYLLLNPRSLDFEFSILGGLRVDGPSSLRFGPTAFDGQYSETREFTITSGRRRFPSNADAVSVALDIDLPEGVEISSSKATGENELVIGITVSRQEAIDAKTGGEHEGRIKLTSGEQWLLSNDEIPLVVNIAEEELTTLAALKYALIVAACVAAIAFLLYTFRGLRQSIADLFTNKAPPIGKLVVTHDPTKGAAGIINLERLAEKMKVKEVIAGIGPEVHVELPHISMIDKAYAFSGRKVMDDVQTSVEALRTTDEVIINDMSITGQARLQHLDRLKLGDFEFRYEIPRPLRQVVLYYLDGEVRQGWLLSWNIETDGFHFLLRGPRSKEAYIRFYELKAVAFVRDFDGELTSRLLSPKAPRSGHRVRLFLADQEELTGYVLNWEDPGEKFYIFPDSMGDNVMLFLIEKSTIRNMVLLNEDERAAVRARKSLAAVLGEMKKEVGG